MLLLDPRVLVADNIYTNSPLMHIHSMQAGTPSLEPWKYSSAYSIYLPLTKQIRASEWNSNSWHIGNFQQPVNK